MSVKVFAGTSLGQKRLYLIDIEKNRLETVTEHGTDPEAIDYIASHLPPLTDEEKKVATSTKSRIKVD